MMFNFKINFLIRLALSGKLQMKLDMNLSKSRAPKTRIQIYVFWLRAISEQIYDNIKILF